MTRQTDTEHTTDIRVPPGTVEALEEDVLGPHADRVEDPKPDADAYAARAAWDGLTPRADAYFFRFDLTNPGEKAAAVWLMYELHRLIDARPGTIPARVFEKRHVFGRIVVELYDALREAETVGVAA